MTNKNENIGFGLAYLRTEQFAIIDANYDTEKLVHYNIGFSSSKDDEQKVIIVMFRVQFEQDNKPFIILESSCHFNIEESAWETFLVKENNSLLVPKGFFTHLCVLTVGTARGILHAKTEGTNFNGFILPTLNLTELITEDAVIN